MKNKLWIVVAALVAVVLLPVMLRSRHSAPIHTDDVLIVVSPHNEAIRAEFARAFAADHLRRTGRTVRIDWRTPGGSSEITRYLAALYLGDRPGCGIDVLFGGGAYDFIQHANAGRLAPSRALKDLPFPETLGGEQYRDAEGRWSGAALSAFGIVSNEDALRRVGFPGRPTRWSDLADPRLRRKIAVADPTQSGSAAKAYELLIQQQIAEAGGDVAEGWRRAMRLLRRIGANSRYFSDAATRIVWDVESGDAAAGMAIDFYGRFQSEAVRRADGTSRLLYITPQGGSSFGADPIGLLRGAPSPELAEEFIAFVMSPEGQKLWNWKVGTPGGPTQYALRRLPILPELYAPEYLEFRSDPDVNPYEWAASNPPYHPEWTGRLFRAIGFIIRAMAIDPHDELTEAWEALVAAGFPPKATALFDNVDAVDYDTVKNVIQPVLSGTSKIEVSQLSRKLCDSFRAQYRQVTELARRGE